MRPPPTIKSVPSSTDPDIATTLRITEPACTPATAEPHARTTLPPRREEPRQRASAAARSSSHDTTSISTRPTRDLLSAETSHLSGDRFRPLGLLGARHRIGDRGHVSPCRCRMIATPRRRSPAPPRPAASAEQGGPEVPRAPCKFVNAGSGSRGFLHVLPAGRSTWTLRCSS